MFLAIFCFRSEQKRPFHRSFLLKHARVQTYTYIRDAASKCQRSRNLYYKSECTCAPAYSEIPVLADRNERSFYFDGVFQFSGFLWKSFELLSRNFCSAQQIKDEDESRGEEEGERGRKPSEMSGNTETRDVATRHEYCALRILAMRNLNISSWCGIAVCFVWMCVCARARAGGIHW